MQQIIIDLIKYFTDLTPAKALRFLTAIVIVILSWIIFMAVQKEQAEVKTAKVEAVIQRFACEDEKKKLIKEKDSILNSLYQIQLGQYQNQLAEAKKLLISSNKTVKEIKYLKK